MEPIIENKHKEKSTLKKILGHVGAFFLVLIAISLCTDLLHKNLPLGIVGFILIPPLTIRLLTKFGYNVKISPLFQETRFVTIAKYVLLGFALVLILIFA